MGNGSFSQEDGGTFVNSAAASLDFLGSANWYTNDGTVMLVNAGTISTAPGSGTTTITVSLLNTGTVAADSGTLVLSGGGDATGSFNVASGAALAFNVAGALLTFDAGSSVAGPGTVAFSSYYRPLSAIFQAGSFYDVTGNTWVGSAATLRFLAGSNVAALGDIGLSGGTLDFSTGSPIVASSLVQTGGIIAGSDTITVSGTITWTGGTMDGPGTTVAQGALQLGTDDGSAHTEALAARTFDNAGTAAWLGNNSFAQSDGSTFVNLPGGSLAFQGGGTWSNPSGDAQLINQGTIQTLPGSGSITIDSFLSNSAEIAIGTGNASFQAGGDLTGSFNVTAGATLVFGGPDAFSFEPSSSVSGAGNVVYNFGSGTAFTIINSNVSGTLTIASGVVAIEGDVTVGALVLSSGILTGSGTLTVTGITTWTGGSMSGSGTTIAQGGLQLGDDDGYYHAELLEGRTLLNTGAATWVGAGVLYQYDSSTFDNQAGATLDFLATGYWYSGDGTGRLMNEGTIAASPGGGTTSVAVFLENSGTLSVAAGALDLAVGGIEAGGFAVTAGASLDLGAGEQVFAAGSSISGPGTVTLAGSSFSALADATFLAGSSFDVTGATTVAYYAGLSFLTGSSAPATGDLTIGGGTVDFATGSAVALADFDLWSGTLTGPDAITVSGSTTWSGGIMSGTGSTTAQGGMQLGSANGGNEDLYARTLTNEGTANWLGENFLDQEDGADFINLPAATLDFQTGGTWYNNDGTPALINQGALTIEAGSNTVYLYAQLDNTSTVGVQSGGFWLYGGLDNSGAILVQSGVLTLAGNSFASGTLGVSTGAGLAFDGYNSIYSFGATSVISGGGTVSFSGYNSLLDDSGAYALTGPSQVSNGTVDFQAARASDEWRSAFPAARSTSAPGPRSVCPT